MAARDGARTDRGGLVGPILALVAATAAAALVAGASTPPFLLAIAVALASLVALLLHLAGRPEPAQVLGSLALLLAGATVASAYGGLGPAIGMVLTALAMTALLLLWPSDPDRASVLVAAGLLAGALLHRLV